MRISLKELGKLLNRTELPNFPCVSSPVVASPRKYRNQPTMFDGKRFDSRLEAKCYQWLDLRKAWGEVAWVIRRPCFELPGGVRYYADFLAVLTAGGVEVIDAKGRETQASKNKRKQVKAIYGVDVRLWPARSAS